MSSVSKRLIIRGSKNMKLYDTVWREASAEQTIERSRFIAHVRPIGSREEAEAFIARIRTVSYTHLTLPTICSV